MIAASAGASQGNAAVSKRILLLKCLLHSRTASHPAGGGGARDREQLLARLDRLCLAGCVITPAHWAAPVRFIPPRSRPLRVVKVNLNMAPASCRSAAARKTPAGLLHL